MVVELVSESDLTLVATQAKLHQEIFKTLQRLNLLHGYQQINEHSIHYISKYRILLQWSCEFQFANTSLIWRVSILNGWNLSSSMNHVSYVNKATSGYQKSTLTLYVYNLHVMKSLYPVCRHWRALLDLLHVLIIILHDHLHQLLLLLCQPSCNRPASHSQSSHNTACVFNTSLHNMTTCE